jgi:ABC-type transporter Mla subunit MlaD
MKNELAAGGFVLAAVAGILAVAIWLSGLHLGGHHAYVTATMNVGDTSIRPDSAVRVGTVEVGKVDRVSPSADWKSCTYRIRLTRNVVLRQDARVLATAPTLGGVGSLTVLDLGSPAAPAADSLHPARLDVGPNPLVGNMLSEIGYGSEQREAFQQAITNIHLALEGVRGMTDALQGQLSPSDSASLLGEAKAAVVAVRHAAQNAETATGQTAEMICAVRPRVEEAVANVADSAAAVGQYTKGDLAVLLQNLRQASSRVLAATTDLRDVAGTAKDVVHKQRPSIESIIADLSQVSDNLKATSRDVRRRPWLLLAKSDGQDVRSRNIESAALAFSDGAKQLDAALESLKTLSPGTDGAASATTTTKPVAADDPQLLLIRQHLDDTFERFTAAEQSLWKELAQ